MSDKPNYANAGVERYWDAVRRIAAERGIGLTEAKLHYDRERIAAAMAKPTPQPHAESD